jgi:hypothetical protein
MKDFIGQIRDTLQRSNPSGTWHYARNIVLTKGVKSVANEDGIKYSYLVPGTVIGYIVTNYHVVYLHKNAEGIDEIGRVNLNNEVPVYESIVKSNLFNFQYNCPIEGIFVYNYREELIISWCDGIFSNSNSPRVLNLDNLPFALNPDKTLVNPSDFYNINLTPNKLQGNLDIEYLDAGSLPGYVAYITHTYILNDDTSTGYFQSSDIGYLGIYANPVEAKGLGLHFSNLDPSYTRLRIGLVFLIEAVGETPASLVGYESDIIEYSGGILDINITSLENYVITDPESIIIESATFEKVNTITKVNNQAHLANVVTSAEFSFQKYANMLNIVPIEYIDEVNDSILSNPKGQDASLMPDEVYALYIQLQRLDGTYTSAFHIPNRPPQGTETDPLDNLQKTDFDLAWTDSEIGIKQFHIFNNGYAKSMARPTDVNPNPIPDDESANRMGYWENTETYPDSNEYNSTVDYEGNPLGGEDLRNTPIRYHRMPGLDSMYDNTLDENGDIVTNANDWEDTQWGLAGRGHTVYPLGEANPIDKKRLRRLGIKVTNIENVIPEEIKNNIQGYRLLHVKRTGGNNYVIGNWALARRTMNGPDLETEFYDFGGVEPLIITNYHFEWEKTRVIANELFKFRPSLSPTFIKTNYRFQLNDYEVELDNGFDVNVNFVGATKDFLDIPNIHKFSKCFTPLIYRPGNSISESTQYSVEGINLDLKPDYLGVNLYNTFPVGTPNNTMRNNPYMTRVLLNTTAYVFKNNCYSGFKSDKLNIIGRVGHITNNTIFKGGDVFSETKFDAIIRAVYTLYSPDFFGGNTVGHGIIIMPLEFRGLFSPSNCTELSIEQPVELDDTGIDLNVLNYNFEILGQEGLSSIHDVNTIFTLDVNSPFVNRFPYRIYRGLKIPNESLSADALSTYPINNYYEMPNDKGEIIAIRGKERMLFIQHRYSLFVASIKDKLRTEGEDTYLGTSDLFDRVPEEILSEDKGYVGSTSKFSCMVIRGMYIANNQITGQIFIVSNNGIIEISSLGNKNWFYNNWDTGIKSYYIAYNGERRRVDNPYLSVGHLVAFDKQFNRLLFTKKDFDFRFPDDVGEGKTYTTDGEFYYQGGNRVEFDDSKFINKSVTLSFNLEENKWSWICNHDYFPNLFFYAFKGLYSGLNKLTPSVGCSVYEHNDKLTKGLFYGGKFVSYVDLIFNQSSDITKLLHSITLVTDVINSNGGNEFTKTITHIMIYNENQCSGIINIKDNYLKVTRTANKEWNINGFRDLIINPTNPIIDEKGDLIQSNINLAKLWFEKSNFISKFITVRLIIDNIDNDDVYIHEVKANSIKSNR